MFLLAILLVAAAVPEPEGLQVEASLLDGASMQGELKAWEADHIVLRTTDGETSLKLAALQSLRPTTVPPRDAQQNDALVGPNGSGAKPSDRSASGDGETADPDALQPMTVEFIDGTRLKVGELQMGSDAATFARQGGAPPQKVGAKHVRRIELQLLTPAASELVERFRDRSEGGDVLVINKQKGESADYIVGEVKEVDARRVVFTWEGETLEVNRSKAAAIVFYRPEAADESEGSGEQGDASRGSSRLLFADGSEVVARSVTMTGELLKLRTAVETDLEFPLGQLEFVDLSLGKLSYLSDMQPVASSWTPLIGLPVADSQLASFGEFRRNQSFGGDALSLRRGHPQRIGRAEIEIFGRGLALRSRTELTYNISRGMARFTAVAGIDPKTSAEGSVVLKFFGDRQLLWEGRVDGMEAPVEISIDLNGARRLGVLVDYGDNLDSGDRLHLVNARLSK